MTTGMWAKLSGGGGLLTCHSRPRDRHGFPVAGSRQNSVDITKLYRKMSMDAPSANAEIDTQSFRVSRLRAYSKTRRGMPSSPSTNSGMKVVLKKMNIVQKCHLPSFSLSWMPIIFGSQ